MLSDVRMDWSAIAVGVILLALQGPPEASADGDESCILMRIGW